MSIYPLQQFIYSTIQTKALNGTPTITSVSPNSGATAGGNEVVINGANFMVTCNFIKVSAGDNHSLAVDPQGQVWAWGRNNYGQIGNGTTTDSKLPINISTISGSPLVGKNITSISAGSHHSLVIDSEGQVYAWGRNYYGELGNNKTSDNNANPMPENISIVSVSPLVGKNIASISAGGYHSLATDDQGQVYTWGNNSSGQLGDNTTTDSSLPKNISTVSSSSLVGKNITSVSAGSKHSLAIDFTGQVYAWGDNYNGQLGNGTYSGFNSNNPLPINISVISGSPLIGRTITSALAGGQHSLAIDSGGQTYAWGSNSYGQLGSNVTASSNMPVNISIVSGSPLVGKNITSVSVGFYHSLVIDNQGQVYAWGSNSYGQLGNNTATNSRIPINISAVSGSPLVGKNISSISGGEYHSLVIDSTGQVYTWGYNNYGQLGNNITTDSSLPVGPLSLPQITSVKFGGTGVTSFTVNSDTSIIVKVPAHTAGSVTVSLTKTDGTVINKTNAYTYKAPTITNINPNKGLMAGGTEVEITGQNFLAQNYNFVQVSAGGSHSLAIDSEGQVWAWGSNGYGELGNNTIVNSPVPINISVTFNSPIAGKNITSVSAGNSYSLAIDSEGQVYTWGRNNRGQLGNNTTSGYSDPNPLPINISTIPGSPIIGKK